MSPLAEAAPLGPLSELGAVEAHGAAAWYAPSIWYTEQKLAEAFSHGTAAGFQLAATLGSATAPGAQGSAASLGAEPQREAPRGLASEELQMLVEFVEVDLLAKGAETITAKAAERPAGPAAGDVGVGGAP